MAGPSNGDRGALGKMFEAVREADIETLTEMLETSSRLNLDQLMDGQHILHVSLDHLDMTQVLLTHGANPNIPDEKGWCPIHYATKRNFVETVMLLLQTGADIDLKTKEENKKEQKSALQIAVEYGAQACEDLLLFACAKIPGKQDGENHDIADGFLDEENPEMPDGVLDKNDEKNVKTPDGLLDKEDEENHKILMRGINDG
ncbi:WARA-like protein [Mya arenaria]|uniref:WARA-like protein n=2 Tax=Mya arenaria TaxID=6604 RepID=A0ABY7EA47_MYAAR|nr:WARA-like protein [Mya arenaria]